MNESDQLSTITDELALHYHLMHPGEDSLPGDPNVAFCIDGVYHLHYILRRGREDDHFSFAHVTSPDMLHWTWEPTKLYPGFAGHGMFSGTGFITKEGLPAAIYHGFGSGRNQIAVAKNSTIDEWSKPFPVEPLTQEGDAPDIRHWDPDCFIIGETYYAISGGQRPQLMKSVNLKTWMHVGDFLKFDLPEIAIGEDISCPNFFRFADKWMLLCISHPFGCRYYLGDWDDVSEQFVPESHGRMNWPRPGQSGELYRDFFAPESLLTTDGRRVMWAWLTTLTDTLEWKSLQSLPRELSLHADGTLRIAPLSELTKLRYDGEVIEDVIIEPQDSTEKTSKTPIIAILDGDAYEIDITVSRKEANRKRFGVRLFADGQHEGLSITIEPETGLIRLGETTAPFCVSDLPIGEDVKLRIFVDKYLVEVFINDRQALLGTYMEYRKANQMRGYTFHDKTILKKVDIWRLKPTTEGFLEARDNRVWVPPDWE